MSAIRAYPVQSIDSVDGGQSLSAVPHLRIVDDEYLREREITNRVLRQREDIGQMNTQVRHRDPVQPLTEPAHSRTGYRMLVVTALRKAVKVIAIMAFAIAAGVGIGMLVYDPGYTGYTTEIIVQPGETLIELASGFNSGMPLPEALQTIREMNGLTTDQVVAGQRLMVPAGH
ncbi:MAG: LysM peptidoglycan-binding domain-containing protein [Varibaculum sp.]|nr:LysM peptidoglycan-binding domain-containing protein [Varibaculum sp.]